jgi:uncharacterized protein (DUF2141 family)
MTIQRISAILFLLLLAACAQINALTGGADDETAPAIDSAKTFPYSGQTNFDGNEVQLKFDEYIILNKPADNIIITPRQTLAPVIKSHNKTLTITFVEPLQDNTTYTILFNHAVADITEKNDSVFQYVFSTGDYIDSLVLRGNVTDAFTNKPASGFLVALYPADTEAAFDSIPFKFKPTYITQTDKGGNFKLNYLKGGTYYIYAIGDLNKNLLLQSDEQIAFLQQRTVLVNESNEPVALKAYQQEMTETEMSRVNYEAPGRLELIFSNPPDTFEISTSMQLLEENTGKKDSLVFWLSEKPTPKMRFATTLNGETDTLRPIYKSGTEEQRKVTITTNTTEGKLFPGEPLKLTFSEPVALYGVNPAGVRLMRTDSTFFEPLFEVENVRTLVLKNQPAEKTTLVIDSAAFTSIYGAINSAAQTVVFEQHPLSYYGSLVVMTDTAFATPGIVYLLDAKGIAVDTVVFSKTMKFENLLPGDYQLQLILDADGNGKWTGGSLKEGRIPEKVIYFNEPVTIKSKWEKEVEWIFNSESQ